MTSPYFWQADHMDLSDQRISYETEGLDLESFSADPIDVFQRWFEEAQAGGEPEPYAMVLATIDEGGWPASRAVLLRQVDA